MNIRYSLAFLLISLPLILTSCFAPKVIKQEYELFKTTIATDHRVSQHYFNFGPHRLFYAAAGDPRKPAMIIMHGTPGDWRQYARYIVDERLLERFYMIVIDRPGWGQSSLGDDLELASFDLHSDILAALARSLKDSSGNQPVIVMGHSLGASIAPKIAMKHPDAVDGLLLFAGTLSPQLSQPRWFNWLADLALFNAVIGDDLRRSNQEILALKSEMQAMSAHWQKMQTPTLVVQGMKDKLVYPDNIVFAETALNKHFTQSIRLEQDGHLFPMKRRDDVVFWANCLLDSAQGLAYASASGIALKSQPLQDCRR